jgi:hypothetical protein
VSSQPLSQRAIALLLLQKEPALWQIAQQSGQTLALEIAIEQVQGQLNEPLAAAIAKILKVLSKGNFNRKLRPLTELRTAF